MSYEVERKFRLVDPGSFQERAAAAGANFGDAITQVDQYFAHPARDFAVTDEALRVRFADGECRITYKGPKVSAGTKTRREIELPFDQSVSDPSQVSQLLEVIGFKPVATVHKVRRREEPARGKFKLSIDLDEVRDLGSFVELDTTAGEDQIDEAERVMAQLANELALAGDLRESYLELLLGAGM